MDEGEEPLLEAINNREAVSWLLENTCSIGRSVCGGERERGSRGGLVDPHIVLGCSGGGLGDVDLLGGLIGVRGTKNDSGGDVGGGSGCSSSRGCGGIGSPGRRVSTSSVFDLFDGSFIPDTGPCLCLCGGGGRFYSLFET